MAATMTSTHQKKDNDDQFGIFITSAIRQIKNKKRKIQVKHKILKILMEAEEDEINYE